MHVRFVSLAQFKFTHTKRAKSSAHYFAIGLFGKLTAKDVWFPEPSTRDPILRVSYFHINYLTN